MQDHLPPVSTSASRKLPHALSLSHTPRPGRADRRSIICTPPLATFTQSDVFFHTSSHQRQHELRSYRMLLACHLRNATLGPVHSSLESQYIRNPCGNSSSTHDGVRGAIVARKNQRAIASSLKPTRRIEERSSPSPIKSNSERHAPRVRSCNDGGCPFREMGDIVP